MSKAQRETQVELHRFTTFPQFCGISTRFGALRVNFHRIFIPRPCFGVDKMSRAMEVFTGARKNFDFLREKTQNCHSKYRNRVGPTLGPKTLSILAFNLSLIHEL
jgi:hypothetical protein